MLPWLDSRKLCNAHKQVKGTVSLSQLDGLRSYLASDAGDIEMTLQFQRDEMNRAVAVGQVQANAIEVTCQRCLEPVQLMLQADINIVMVASDEQAAKIEKNTNHQLETWVVGDGQLNVAQLVDQELVLSLPLVSYHASCSVKTEYGDKVQAEQKTNPFDVLAELLPKNN